MSRALWSCAIFQTTARAWQCIQMCGGGQGLARLKKFLGGFEGQYPCIVRATTRGPLPWHAWTTSVVVNNSLLAPLCCAERPWARERQAHAGSGVK